MKPLSKSELAVFDYLHRRIKVKTGLVQVPRRDIAAHINRCSRTVSRLLRSLERRNLLEVVERPSALPYVYRPKSFRDAAY